MLEDVKPVLEWYCKKCKAWVQVPRGMPPIEAKREHAELDAKVDDLFATEEMLELDVQLEAWYDHPA